MCRYAAQMTYDLSLAPLDLLSMDCGYSRDCRHDKRNCRIRDADDFHHRHDHFRRSRFGAGPVDSSDTCDQCLAGGPAGFSAALKSLYDHRWFLGLGYGVLLASTQLVPLLSQDLFFLCLGVLVVGFASLMLSGWSPQGRSGLACPLPMRSLAALAVQFLAFGARQQ